MTARVQLVPLDAPVLDALAAGDEASALLLAPVPLSPWLTGPECRRTWAMRARQVAGDPGAADWITRVVLDADRGMAVGRAGFHGPPDGDGMVEVGYAIDPRFRRQGYARAVLRALLAEAAVAPGVTTVRASVSPDNPASRDLVLSEGFVRVGEQIDEDDGPEFVYEVAVPSSSQTTGVETPDSQSRRSTP